MGCGAAIDALHGAWQRFGLGEDPIWMDEILCKEGDRRLQECRFDGWGNHDCIHYEDAGVICYPGI